MSQQEKLNSKHASLFTLTCAMSQTFHLMAEQEN